MSFRPLCQNRLFLYVPFMKQHNYYVYLLTSTDNSTFYVGVTNDLIRRVLEHKIHKNDGFTSKYNITKLVYFETYSNKANLVTRDNSDWNDLSSQIGITKEMINKAMHFQDGAPGTESGVTRCDLL